MSFIRYFVVLNHIKALMPIRNKSTQMKRKWKSVVGLEIHAQINTKSKLFSGSANDPNATVNTCVSLFDASVPGTLPVLNKRCVELAVITSLALNCKVNEVSMFDRKHYFYADLPTGYQITQQRAPIASDGILEFQVYTPSVHTKPYRKFSKIKQIQLEQDSGKSLHDATANQSLVDLNRAGVPLMELVFEPDLQDGEEAAALVKEVIMLLKRIDSCSCKLEEGNLRVDANVSIHQEDEPLGVRTEIKNIGSVRAVAGAIKHEIERQTSLMESGGVVVNQTRAWDAVTKTTIPMRDKEIVQDYRYMPEPNLPPLRLCTTGKNSSLVNIPMLKSQIPELPEETRSKLITKYNVRPDIAIILLNFHVLLNYFIEITSKSRRNPKKVANVLIMELLTVLNKEDIDLDDCPLTSESLGEVIDLLENNSINLLISRKVIKAMIETKRYQPYNIVKENDWFLISDEESITNICKKIIEENEAVVKIYKKGKSKAFKALMKIAVKQTNEKADMGAIAKKMEELLSK